MVKVSSIISGILRFRSKFSEQQINRSVKKYSDIQQIKLKNMVDYLLRNEDVGYEDFLELIDFQENKSKLNINCNDEDEELYKIALGWVFSDSYFNNNFSEKKFEEVLENWIEISRDYKENVFLGASGSGKTSLFKYLIGAEKSSYPAVSDGNTTVGKSRIVIDLFCNKLSFAVWLKNKEDIIERLNIYIQDCVDLCLKNECTDKLFDELYDALILSKDSKWRLEFIIKEDDLRNLEIEKNNFLKAIHLEAQVVWSKFKKSKYFDEYNFKSDISYNEALTKALSIQQDVKKFVANEIDNEESVINRVINEIYNIIVDNQYITINRIYKLLCEKKDILNFKLQAIFNNIKIKITSNDIENNYLDIRDKFETIEMLCVEIDYKSGNKPDEELRNYFFKILECISSSEKKNYNLFPFLNEMRVYGNFRPDGFIYDDISDKKEIFVISDYEGILHDVSSSNILSTKTQSVIMNANKILLTYNTSTAESKTGIIPILEYLIISGAMYKTKICFTKLDLLNDNDKKTRIKGYMKNILEAIEKNSNIEGLDKEMQLNRIMEEACYFSNMNKIIDDNPNILIFKEKYEKFKNIDKELAKELEEIIQNLEKKNATIEKIIPLYNEFMNNINSEGVEQYLINIKKPFNILVSKVVKNSIKAQEEFVNEFMKLLEQSEWQKEKAFNIRMAKNYDGREWRDLMPEAMLITKLNLIIRNCINNDIVNKLEGNAKRCVDIYCDVMLQEMSKEVKKAVKKVIYEGMLDDCWIPASKKRGNGSTNERHILIKKSISECFLNRNEISEEYISLYSIIAETLINNKKFNRLNVKLDCSK